ncbi:anaerobic sulfatase maturase [Parasalinivibrio latis]|uniref:anaerobic sulfatase maturase n=1 Tax=Parasalinivibrio latis TaxID=2952610 RepID=UPI0030DF128A
MQENPLTDCHVMAKPSGARCNIACRYCFYLEKEKLYPDRDTDWRMNDETLERYIRQYIDAQTQDVVEFAWQGGEPTLLGLDFYKKVVKLCRKYSDGKHITHAFQTNGILLNEQWCEFFAEHNFLVGISVDGPEKLHDIYRVNRAGKPTFAVVRKAVDYLKKSNVSFNTLTVVHSDNADYAEDIYQCLKGLGAIHMQFIPLLERQPTESSDYLVSLSEPDANFGNVTPWSVSPQQYGRFLNRLFDVWVTQDVGTVFVQQFENTLASWLGHPSGSCIFSETCGKALVLEANGDVYCCDHYVYPNYKLGNIAEDELKHLVISDKAVEFGNSKRRDLTQSCITCEYRFACHGGCPKHRIVTSPLGQPRHNYFCQSYKAYFQHTEPYMKIMAHLVSQGRPASDIIPFLASRNIQQSG